MPLCSPQPSPGVFLGLEHALTIAHTIIVLRSWGYGHATTHKSIWFREDRQALVTGSVLSWRHVCISIRLVSHTLENDMAVVTDLVCWLVGGLVLFQRPKRCWVTLGGWCWVTRGRLGTPWSLWVWNPCRRWRVGRDLYFGGLHLCWDPRSIERLSPHFIYKGRGPCNGWMITQLLLLMKSHQHLTDERETPNNFQQRLFPKGFCDVSENDDRHVGASRLLGTEACM